MVGKRRRSNLGRIDTSEKEEELRNLLLDIVDEKGDVSKYTLEGHLLYTLECNNLQMYNVIMSLTNSKELVPFDLNDGSYYKYYPK